MRFILAALISIALPYSAHAVATADHAIERIERAHRVIKGGAANKGVEETQAVLGNRPGYGLWDSTNPEAEGSLDLKSQKPPSEDTTK